MFLGEGIPATSKRGLPTLKRTLRRAAFVAGPGMEPESLADGEWVTVLGTEPPQLQFNGVVHAGVQATMAARTAGAATRAGRVRDAARGRAGAVGVEGPRDQARWPLGFVCRGCDDSAPTSGRRRAIAFPTLAADARIRA